MSSSFEMSKAAPVWDFERKLERMVVVSLVGALPFKAERADLRSWWELGDEKHVGGQWDLRSVRLAGSTCSCRPPR